MKITTRSQTLQLKKEREILELQKENQELKSKLYKMMKEYRETIVRKEEENKELIYDLELALEGEKMFEVKYKRAIKKIKYLKGGDKKFYAKHWKLEQKYKDE